MAPLKSKIKAATILESLIAMVIIMVCIGVSSMIYLNVLDSDKERLQMKLRLLLNDEVSLLKQESLFVDSEKQVEGFTIKVNVSRFDGANNVWVLKLQALDSNGKLILSRNELVTFNHE